MEHMLNRHQLHLFLWVSKQWGYQTVHGTNPVTYDLPIPFEEAPFTVAISTGNSGNHASCGGFTKTTIVLRAGTTAGVWDTVGFFIIGCQLQWGYYTAAVGAIYTDVTTPVSFSRCFLAASIDILLAASTTWPGTTQTVWNINASTANKLRFIWAKAPIELDGAVWFGIFIQTVGNEYTRLGNISYPIYKIQTFSNESSRQCVYGLQGTRKQYFIRVYA